MIVLVCRVTGSDSFHYNHVACCCKSRGGIRLTRVLFLGHV